MIGLGDAMSTLRWLALIAFSSLAASATADETKIDLFAAVRSNDATMSPLFRTSWPTVLM